MPRGIQEHTYVLLRLELRLLRAQLECVAAAAARSVTSKSRCIIICCPPGVLGQTGRR